MKNLCVYGILALLSAYLQAADVKQLYTQHCQVCHGDKGQGGLGSSLVDGIWTHGSTDADHAKVITDGLPAFDMQAFGNVLNDKEVRALVIYIQELELRADPVKAPPLEQGIYQSQHQNFRLQEVLRNPAKMWGVSFLPEGRKIITEIDGPVRIIDADGTLLPPIEDTPKIARKGQGGMLDVAVHPDYAENGWIYLSFAEGTPDNCITGVVRGRVKDNRWVDQQDIYRAPEKFRSNAGVHFGSRIVFHDGYVFFSIGERGAGHLAQDLNRPNGKIQRFYDDGRIPEDNPFVGESEVPGIWTRGHRNPQALAFRPGTDELWETEHGPRGGDELNRIRKGLNYGWPTVTFGMNYNGTPITDKTSLPGIEDPVWHWTPSIATCGMAFVDGNRYPGWQGDLLIGGLKAEVVERLRLGENGVEEREVLVKNQGRVRDIKTGPDGYIYLILEGRGSRLVRLVPE